MTSDAGPGTSAFHDRRPGLQSVLLFLVSAVLLAAAHFGLALLWPMLTRTADSSASTSAGSTLNPAVNLALYVANLFVLASILIGVGARRASTLAAYAFGYAAMVWLLWPLIRVMDENLLLLAIAALVFGGLARHPWLLGYLYLFLLSQRFLPAYLYSAFLVSSLLYTTLRPFALAWRHQHKRFLPICHLAGLILLTGLLLPIVFFCGQSSPQELQQRLREAEVLSALGVSLKTSALATLLVFLLGVPFAYAIVRTSYPGRGLIDTLIDLPIVVPPPIAGIAILAFLGPRSPLGAFLESRLGLTFFDSEWAIVVAQLFVSSPYLIRASMVAFAAVDVRHENVARTLGATPIGTFLRVTFPMSLRGILIGVILTWFRAMAEFGSLRIMANRPRTIPILAYERFIEFRQTESHSVAVLALLLSFSVVIGMWIIRSMPAILGRSIGVSDASP